MELLRFDTARNVFSEPQWYALSVRSRFEKKSNAELIKRGIESYLPLVEEVHLWSDRKKTVHEPLFRGYVFVKSDLQNKLTILQTDGVVRFVGVRNHPSPIPEREVNWIRLLGGHPSLVQREEYQVVGEAVRIIAGPFRGLEGFISQIKDRSRVVVSFTSIAQSVSVEVASHFIERIQSSRSVLVGSL